MATQSSSFFRAEQIRESISGLLCGAAIMFIALVVVGFFTSPAVG